MSDDKVGSKTERTKSSESYYLCMTDASAVSEEELAPATVFNHVANRELAETLVFMCEKDSQGMGLRFYYRPSGELATGTQVLLDDAINELNLYDDFDPGVYELAPSKFTLSKAYYMRQTTHWGETIKETAAELQAPNQDLHLLLLFAQGYHEIVANAIGNDCHALDMQLTESYFWIVRHLRNLLANSKHLQDFPLTFDPVFSDLAPSSIADLEWDVVAPRVEEFLMAVQRYVGEKGICPIEAKPNVLSIVEIFRPQVLEAVKAARDYRSRMQRAMPAVLQRAGLVASSSEQTKAQAENACTSASAKQTVQPPRRGSPQKATLAEVERELAAALMNPERLTELAQLSDRKLADEFNTHPATVRKTEAFQVLARYRGKGVPRPMTVKSGDLDQFVANDSELKQKRGLLRARPTR